VNSVGTVGFSINGVRIEMGQTRQLMWNGVSWNIVGEQINGVEQRVAIKQADESYSDSIVLQNDNDLFFSIAPGDTWIGQIDLTYAASTSRDMRFAISAPAGAKCSISIMEPGSISSPNTDVACGDPLFVATDTTTGEPATIVFSLTNGATAGNVTLQWALGSVGSATNTVFSGSFLRAFRVSGADYAEIYYSNDMTIRE